MKKFQLTVALAAALMSTTLLSCGGNDNDASTPATGMKDPEAFSPQEGLNIRFIDADSVMAGYELAKEFQELTLSQLSRLESTAQGRQTELQKMAADIENKARNNGYLSQQSYESDMANFNKRQQEASNQMARLERQAQIDAAQRQTELTDSLQSFINDYNAKKGYDAILYKAAGVYFNPALDITQEVIDGLNARYRKNKK